jgi:4'-phosphopantetheinyl transferase EntD
MSSRALAGAALLKLGFVDVPILSGERGDPRWPPGVVGSISHCDRLCIAAVTSRQQIIGMGVDIECAAPLDVMLHSYVCTPQEIARLKDLGNEGFWAKVSFSSKESIYKCLYPFVGRFIEFDEVEVTLDITRGAFTAYPFRSDLRLPSGASFSGRFRSVGGYVYTTAVLTTTTG